MLKCEKALLLKVTHIILASDAFMIKEGLHKWTLQRLNISPLYNLIRPSNLDEPQTYTTLYIWVETQLYLGPLIFKVPSGIS